jgi:hypothetical protein
LVSSAPCTVAGARHRQPPRPYVLCSLRVLDLDHRVTGKRRRAARRTSGPGAGLPSRAEGCRLVCRKCRTARGIKCGGTRFETHGCRVRATEVYCGSLLLVAVTGAETSSSCTNQTVQGAADRPGPFVPGEVACSFRHFYPGPGDPVGGHPR